MTRPPPYFEIRGVSAGYGGDDIVSSVSLAVDKGRLMVIAGPNGAGKSTLVKALAGLLKPRQGQILIDGADVSHLPPPQRALRGLGYVPQERNVFRNLTIGENLRIGFEFIKPRASKADYIAARDRVLDLFPDLASRLKHVAGTLSGGQRQMLAMGCALVPGPAVMLLDEPSAGLSPRYVTAMLDAVSSVNRSGVTVIMVEQNLIEAARVAHGVALLVAGKVEGVWEPDLFLSDTLVKALFLGHTQAKQPAPAGA